MNELVAIDLPPGDAFVVALRRIWDRGDAAFPIDHRLPVPARQRLVDALRPGRILDRSGETEWLDGAPVESGDALVMATSGTTGEPKGVVLTHAALAASARATSEALGVDPERDHWVSCLPLAHIGGMSVVTRSLVTSTRLSVLDRFDPAEVEVLGRRGATLISLVATALRRVDASGYRAVLLGGAAPPARVATNVITTYGMTETGSGVVYDGLPLPGVEIRIDRPGTDGSGEIHLRGAMLLRSYRFTPSPLDADGWLPTGDGGRLFDGRLEVHGRLTEVIVSGGEKIWPIPVEQLLATAPGVAEAAVWKRADPEWGERVVAWVVPDDPARPPLLDELRAVIQAELAPYCAPKELVLLAELPRAPGGKVLRRQLI